MSLYDAAKDALKIAQSLDNVELIQKIIDVQAQALDMQEIQQKQSKKIHELEKEIEAINEAKKYEFAPGKMWLKDPDDERRKLCPVCTKREKIPVPLNNTYCFQCKGYY